MSSKHVVAVVALVTVFTWSVVMAALGQLAAIATLVPSLGLLVQQVAQALTGTEARRSAAVPSSADKDEEHAR